MVVVVVCGHGCWSDEFGGGGDSGLGGMTLARGCVARGSEGGG